MMQIATVRSQEIWLRGTRLFCPEVPTPALTPALALDYLDELSTDIESVVVLDGAGQVAAATAPTVRLSGPRFSLTSRPRGP